MSDNDTFTIGVFQDTEWARRGLEALREDGFTADMISVVAKDTPETASLIESALGAAPDRLEIKGIGAAVARGTLVGALQGSDGGLKTEGVGRTIARAGFQQHDGYIFETLVGRGGVLVAIRDERRAADALAKLHAYGGGNAAIGAWTGRL
jgi:hypothetical protein